MPIEIPSLDELHERLMDAFRGAFPDRDASRTGDDWKRLRVVAGQGFQLNHHVAVVADDLMADTAGEATIERHGYMYNVARKAATPARKADALRLVGTAGSAYAVGDELTSPAGLRYQVNEAGTIPGAGFVDVDVVAIDTGAATKLEAGAVLTFTSPPSGIEAQAELQLDLDEDGEDVEELAAYKARVLNRIRQPGKGGTANDYEQLALAETGIAAAYVYPIRGGVGTVDIVALHAGTGSVRLLTEPERTALLAAMTDQIPVAVKAGTSFRILSVVAVEQDVEILVEPLSAEYEFDWSDAGGPLVVASWTAGTRTLELTTSRPTDMREGDRIVIKTAAGDGTGEVFTIERLGAAADEIILDREPDPAPVATDQVYAGGPLTDVVRDAILEFINQLGPAIGTHGIGTWEDSVEPGRIDAIAYAQEGVRRAQTTTPATAITPDDPAYPDDDEIELLVPGRVIVRRMS